MMVAVYCVFYNAGKHPEVPPFPFKSIKKKFHFLSLTTSPEAISVLEHVRVECGKVCAMSLFHTGVSKHLKLEEFDQAQHQASMQVRAMAGTIVAFCKLSISLCVYNFVSTPGTTV